MIDVLTISVIKTTTTTVTIMTTVTSVAISPFSTIDTLQILSPTGSSYTINSGGQWVGGILVGVVSGVLVIKYL